MSQIPVGSKSSSFHLMFYLQYKASERDGVHFCRALVGSPKISQVGRQSKTRALEENSNFLVKIERNTSSRGHRRLEGVIRGYAIQSAKIETNQIRAA